jgi:hypothetical protein
MSLRDALIRSKELEQRIKQDQVEYDRLSRYIRNESERHPVTDAQLAEMRELQVRTDTIFRGLGKATPSPLPAERPREFFRRVVSDLAPYSKRWNDVKLENQRDDVLAAIAPQVIADASEEARRPTSLSLAPGEMREVTEIDERSGQRVTSFQGLTTFIKQFPNFNRRGRFRTPQELRQIGAR